MRTNKTSETQSLSHRITQWAKSNDWYHTDIQTNQLRLEQTFGFAVEHIAGDLEYHNQHRMSRRIFDLYDLLLAKCVKIDTVCRSGCRSEEELLELELLRVRTVGIASELAEVLELLKNKSEIRSTKYSTVPGTPYGGHLTVETNSNYQNLKSQNNNTNEWTTFAQAADIIGVTKGTISKWAAEGKFSDNGQKGQNRRLLKTSVLMVKLEKEDQNLKKDVLDLRRDMRKLA